MCLKWGTNKTPQHCRHAVLLYWPDTILGLEFLTDKNKNMYTAFSELNLSTQGRRQTSGIHKMFIDGRLINFDFLLLF